MKGCKHSLVPKTQAKYHFKRRFYFCLSIDKDVVPPNSVINVRYSVEAPKLVTSEVILMSLNDAKCPTN